MRDFVVDELTEEFVAYFKGHPNECYKLKSILYEIERNLPRGRVVSDRFHDRIRKSPNCMVVYDSCGAFIGYLPSCAKYTESNNKTPGACLFNSRRKEESLCWNCEVSKKPVFHMEDSSPIALENKIGNYRIPTPELPKDPLEKLKKGEKHKIGLGDAIRKNYNLKGREWKIVKR